MGLNPVDLLVGLNPVNLPVGLNPVDLPVALNPVDLLVGMNPMDLRVGLNLVCLRVGLLCAAVQERSVFRRIVLKNAYMRRKMFEELLENVPLLKSLNVRAPQRFFFSSNVDEFKYSLIDRKDSVTSSTF